MLYLYIYISGGWTQLFRYSWSGELTDPHRYFSVQSTTTDSTISSSARRETTTLEGELRVGSFFGGLGNVSHPGRFGRRRPALPQCGLMVRWTRFHPPTSCVVFCVFSTWPSLDKTIDYPHLYYDGRTPTGWFKHKAPNSVRRQCRRHFWELDPEILHALFSVPLPSLERFVYFILFFFVRYLGFVIFGGYLSLKGPHIFGGGKKIAEVSTGAH